MRCLVLLVLGLPKAFNASNSVDGGKFDTKRIDEAGNSDDSIEEPTDWIFSD